MDKKLSHMIVGLTRLILEFVHGMYGVIIYNHANLDYQHEVVCAKQ